MRVTEVSDFGWPYCYYDQIQELKVLNPEYGGDKIAVGRCSEFEDPIIGFPGHFAPNDLLFYRGNQFPERYRRSEEHTSELQSRGHIVCRLLHEKKNKDTTK